MVRPTGYSVLLALGGLLLLSSAILVRATQPADSAGWKSTVARVQQARGARCPALPPPGMGRRVDTVAALQDAVRSLSSGDTILIEPGVYRLTNTLHISGGVQNVSLRGLSGRPDDVVLEGRGMRNAQYGNVPHGILISHASDVLIADLTIRDVYYHPIQVQGEQGAHDLLFYNLHLIDAGEQFIKGSTAGQPGPYPDGGEVACSMLEYTDRARSDYTNGVDVLAGADWVVRDNVFLRIRAPLGQMAGPAVLFWRNSQNTTVERNLFVECDRGIAMGLSRPDPSRARDGDSTYDHQVSIVRNNMIYQPASADTSDIGITVNFARDFKVLHNTVIQNSTFPWGAIEYRFGVSSGEIRNNLTDAPIWRRDGATATLQGNVTDAAPSWFVDPVAADLHLRPSASAAIDQAQVLAEVADDYDGQLRPIGPAADLGADEYGESSSTSTSVAISTSEATSTSVATSTSEATSTREASGTRAATPTIVATETPAASPTGVVTVTLTPVPSPSSTTGPVERFSIFLPRCEVAE